MKKTKKKKIKKRRIVTSGATGITFEYDGKKAEILSSFDIFFFLFYYNLLLNLFHFNNKLRELFKKEIQKSISKISWFDRSWSKILLVGDRVSGCY